MVRSRFALFLLGAAWLMPAIAADTLPFDSPQALQNLGEEEKRVWSQGLELQKALEKGGQLYPDTALNSYLQGVMDKLYPELAGHIRVRAIRSPLLNAFALPDGGVYINTGLLARFENEAQLATVLAHEGAHFVHRHGFRQQQSVKSASAFALVTQLLGVPIVGLLGQVIATSSMFGFSREMETEADNIGFSRLAKAGYDVGESTKVFEYLAKEVELSEVKEPFFYSTHPRLKDRIANFSELSRSYGSGGATFQNEYAKRIETMRMEDLESELSFGRFTHVIALLNDDAARKRYPPYCNYYLGEAYRKRNDKDDATQAAHYFDQAIALAPDFVATYRAKGLLAMQQERNEEAVELFTQYLQLAPQAPDRSYVESYLDMIKTSK
jgi:predicted Zn-dependent protease